MTKDEVIIHLDKLADAESVIKSYQQELTEVVRQAFLNCPDLEVRRQEILLGIEVIAEKKEELLEEITQAVFGTHETFTGKFLQAAFSKGEVNIQPIQEEEK